MTAEPLLAELSAHLARSREILGDLELPKYPGGGAVGLAAVSEMQRCLGRAADELPGLLRQLKAARET